MSGAGMKPKTSVAIAVAERIQRASVRGVERHLAGRGSMYMIFTMRR